VKHFNSILIPNWIEQAILANDKSLADVINYDVMRAILSPEDVLYLLQFQQLNTASFDNSVLGSSIENLSSYWRSNTECPEEVETLTNIAYNSVNNYEAFTSGILTRFSTAAVLGAEDKVFEIHDLSKNLSNSELTYAIVFGQNSLSTEAVNTMSLQTKYDLTESLLKALYSRLPTVQVALLPITKQYIELMKIRVNTNAL